MNRWLLAAALWLALAGLGGTAPAAQPAPNGAGAPRGIHIVNPESTGVAWSYLIDGTAQTLPAGYSQQIDSSCTIAFDRGGGLGESKYTLSDGTYTFTPSNGHWELYRTENAPEGGLAAGIGAVDEGAAKPDPLTPDEGKMFQEMYAKAGLDAAAMKLVEEDWQGKTHAQRKTDYDSFMEQVRAAGREAPRGSTATLFDGTTLNGWHLRDPDGPNCWSVEGGEIVTRPRQGFYGKNLVSDQVFRDFELQLEFLLEDGANSGVYLRGLYEVQLYDDNANVVVPKERCGAIWGQTAPNEEAYLGPGKWNALTVRLVGQRASVTMNGKLVVDDAYLNGPTDNVQTLHIDEGEPGPIMLQCTPGGGVRFRNISITRASATAPAVPSPAASEEDKRMFWQMYRNAGLDQATLKLVSDDWKSKTSAERKAEYDGFVKQVDQMRRSAGKQAPKDNGTPKDNELP